MVDELRVRGLALLTSSGADEFAQERAALTGSVFTLHLVSGLRGAADFDTDGTVTLSEVYRYARQHTEVDTSSTAKPHSPAFLYDLAGQGEPILTYPGEDQARLLLPQERESAMWCWMLTVCAWWRRGAPGRTSGWSSPWRRAPTR